MIRKKCVPDGSFGLLDENLLMKVLANIEDRFDRQSWSLVCKRFLEAEALSRKRVKLLRVETLEGILLRYQYVEELNLSPCMEVNNETLDTVGCLSASSLRSVSLARLTLFTEVGLSRLVLQCPKLRELDLSFCHHIDDYGMFPISFLANLESLKLVNCRKVTDLGLGVVAAGCRELQHLSLRWCVGVTDCSISMVAANCKGLESLDLSYTEVSENGLERITSLQKLRKLTLVSCNRLDDASLACLGKCSKSLLALDVARCDNVSDKGVIALAGGPVCLQELSLSYCQPITDGLLAILEKFECLHIIRLDGCEIAGNELALIGKGCKSLKELSVSKCKGVTDEGIKAVVEGCRDLLELDLTCCRELTDSALASIGRSCHGLQRLKLESCDEVTHQGLADLGNGCRSLEFLDLTDCNVDDEGLKGLASCGALTTLKLAFCPKISDVGIAYIATSCGNLLEIDLYRSSGIGDPSIAAIAYGCPKLMALNFSYCARVTDVGLHSISHLHNLTKLEMRALPLLTSAGLSAVASGCGRLVALDIKHCTEIGDLGLISVSQGCPYLREVNLSFCQITDVGLLAMAKLSCMQNMKLLHLNKVTIDGMRIALFNSGSLKKVKLSSSLQIYLPEATKQTVCKFRESSAQLCDSKALQELQLDWPPATRSTSLGQALLPSHAFS